MSLTAADRAAARPAAKPSPRPGFRVRDLLPRSLYLRTLLIVVTPMVLIQGVVLYIFLADHETRTTANLTRNMIDQVALVVQLANGADDDTKRSELMAEASSKLGLTASWHPDESLPAQPGTTDTDVGIQITKEMQARIPESFWLDATRFGEQVDIRVALPGGTLRFLVERKRFININMHLLPVWMGVFAAVFVVIAVLFLRNQVRPIQQLALAAEAFGRGRDVPDFRPRGAIEVRRAAIAFMGMKQRISRQMTQRTEMLAGVSHDLRTPLTRMKLELAMMPEEETAGLRGDIEEMEHMLEEYLAFARGEGGEHSAPADLAELAAEIADDVRRKGTGSIEVDAPSELIVEVKRSALKRCAMNLIENALRYGTRTRLTLIREDERVLMIVDDDGPGIPQERRAEAFRPFRRLDQGRNLESGGVGLGLAIAQDIARGHGGSVQLTDSPLGGLRATIRLPV